MIVIPLPRGSIQRLKLNYWTSDVLWRAGAGRNVLMTLMYIRLGAAVPYLWVCYEVTQSDICTYFIVQLQFVCDMKLVLPILRGWYSNQCNSLSRSTISSALCLRCKYSIKRIFLDHNSSAGPFSNSFHHLILSCTDPATPCYFYISSLLS